MIHDYKISCYKCRHNIYIVYFFKCYVKNVLTSFISVKEVKKHMYTDHKCRPLFFR